MQITMQTLGYDNVFIGTVEGEPEDTACEAVIEKIKEAGYTKVVLRPLMVVAGDHANNDMAGDDEDSWLSQFKAADCFDSVDTQIAGLGEIADVQQIYIDHTKAAIDSPEWLIYDAYCPEGSTSFRAAFVLCGPGKRCAPKWGCAAAVPRPHAFL